MLDPAAMMANADNSTAGALGAWPGEPTFSGRSSMQTELVVAPWIALFADSDFCTDWDDLEAHVSEPSPFSARWYLEAALKALDPAVQMRLALYYVDGALAGAMPLEQIRGYARLPVLYVTNWLNHNAFLGTPLVREGQERAFWRALLTQLDAQSDGALFFHANGLSIDGPVAKALEAECAEQGRRHALVHREERALLERGLSPSEYLEMHVRGKKRKELRRQHNRLGELGALIFERSESGDGLDPWIDEFLALERAGWKGANGSALDCADETRTLFREALSGAVSAGKLERLTLRLDGRAIAMLVNFLCAPGSFSFKTAFDEDYARFSPGVLLQIENLKLLERDGIDWCDSCAAQDHPMIDSLWAGRRGIGRWSVAIGGRLRRAAFAALVTAEQAKSRMR
jgi:CelD/BcsL family acetyltransferase involved in cellulose biosynthesis